MADRRDMRLLDSEARSEHWGISWKFIDYRDLHNLIDELRSDINNLRSDFILYARNDQIGDRVNIGQVNRLLRVGYSSISGIDESARLQQMQDCFQDFMECGKKVALTRNASHGETDARQNGGMFSLVFDVEQVGGARFGLPRIMNLLDEYGIRATFFVTGIIKRVYPGILDLIQSGGHEIGIHGVWHEFLSNYDDQTQEKYFARMMMEFETQVQGSNFIGRFDETTLRIQLQLGLKYSLYPDINHYHFSSYPKRPTTPVQVSYGDRRMWLIPISVDTYGYPWFSAKSMIDSAHKTSLRSNNHFVVLCHPFRDGNLRHIDVTRKLLRYLTVEKGLAPTRLGDLVSLQTELRKEEPGFWNAGRAHSLGDLVPRTRGDLMGIVPQNLIMAARAISRTRTIW